MADQNQISEDEEFEFRARAEAEAKARAETATPGTEAAPAGSAPVAPGALDMTNPADIGRAIVGAGQTAYDLAVEHPVLAAGAGAMLPNSVLKYVPGGQKIIAGKEFFSNLGNAASAYAQKEARLQNRPGFGGAPSANAPVAPTGVQIEPTMEAPARPAPTRPLGAPSAGPVAPEVAPGEARFGELGKYRPGLDMPRTGLPPGAATPTQEAGASFLDRMMQTASKYAPAVERVGGQIGRAVAPVARVLGSAPVMGAQMMLHSGDTGPAVPSVGRLRGSEINPLSGRPWTRNEIAAYERNPAMYDRQLPAAQLPR
jgi:hypothetical protein